MSDSPHPLIYKIARRADWDEACMEGIFRGSPDDLRDGFIHFSTEDQLEGTARKHFSGQDDLLLIAVESALLGSALKWEPSRGGALFPHLYAGLPTTDVKWTCALPLRDDGWPDIGTALARANP